MGLEDIFHHLQDIKGSGHYESFLLVRMGTQNNAVWPLSRQQGMTCLVALVLRGLVMALIKIVNQYSLSTRETEEDFIYRPSQCYM